MLWNALKSGLIDMIVSDHSPCTADLKRPGEKSFEEAWGGISSVQFGLPIIWSEASKRGFTLKDLYRWMCANPAKLAGLDNIKSKLSVGYNADIAIWDPEEEIEIQEECILHKNKLTPYKGKKLKGKVHWTIVRGKVVYEEGSFTAARGNLLVRPKSASKTNVDISKLSDEASPTAYPLHSTKRA
jgi:allantoinase